jgi:hypothetical protein
MYFNIKRYTKSVFNIAANEKIDLVFTEIETEYEEYLQNIVRALIRNTIAVSYIACEIEDQDLEKIIKNYFIFDNGVYKGKLKINLLYEGNCNLHFIINGEKFKLGEYKKRKKRKI